MSRITCLIALVALAGCGGGGSSSAVAPIVAAPAPNTTPTLSAPPAELSVVENTTGLLHDFDPRDADGDRLTYSLTGEDASRFVLSSAGELRFAETPDHEDPKDANADNVYTLSVRFADPLGASASASLSVRVTDEAYPEQGQLRQRLHSDIDVSRNHEYAPGLYADVFTARGLTDAERPLIILASGGGFSHEDRMRVEPIARDFAERGYLAATIDYRTLGYAPIDESELHFAASRALHDLYAAVRSARAPDGFLAGYAFDPGLVIVGGESAGGVLAVTAGALDPHDTVDAPDMADYFAANGGLYGNVGDHLDQESAIQAALPISTAIFDLNLIDENTVPTFAAHEEMDTIAPCSRTSPSAAFVPARVYGGCDFVADMIGKGVRAELYLVPDDAGHVAFTPAERADIYSGAAELFADALYPVDSSLTRS